MGVALVLPQSRSPVLPRILKFSRENFDYNFEKNQFSFLFFHFLPSFDLGDDSKSHIKLAVNTLLVKLALITI